MVDDGPIHADGTVLATGVFCSVNVLMVAQLPEAVPYAVAAAAVAAVAMWLWTRYVTIRFVPTVAFGSLALFIPLTVVGAVHRNPWLTAFGLVGAAVAASVAVLSLVIIGWGPA